MPKKNGFGTWQGKKMGHCPVKRPWDLSTSPGIYPRGLSIQKIGVLTPKCSILGLKSCRV